MSEPRQLAALLAGLRDRQVEMVELLGDLVNSESPSRQPALLAATADLIAERGADVLGVEPSRLEAQASPVLRWEVPGNHCHAEPVLLLAHLDTVWPAGTTKRWPFSVADGRAIGPGAFDMKAGLVQALFALASLAESALPHPAVTLLVTSDEEIGSPAGRAVVEEAARDAQAALVLEPSEHGRVKVARKGVSNYWLRVTGRAAHAGLEPENGINALIAAARLVLALDSIADPHLGTTVTPTVSEAGSAPNTVPAAAAVAVDVRASSAGEQQRVDAALRALQPGGGAALAVEGNINRPPLKEQAALGLLHLAQTVAGRCGLGAIEPARVGGGSDGNFTAAMGVPTLDRLGAVGAGAHAEGEYVIVSSMPERAALLAGLICELQGHTS